MTINKISEINLSDSLEKDDVLTKCRRCSSERIVKNGHTDGKQKYLCCNCNFQFVKTNVKFWEPFRRDNGSLILCVDCGTDQLYKAGKGASDIQRYKCKVCNRIFTENSQKKPENPPIPQGLSCPDCDSTNLQFKCINRCRKNVRVYECLDCQRGFQENSRRTFTKPSPFPCPDCGSFRATKQKTKQKSGKERIQYHCRDCKRYFSENSKSLAYTPTIDPDSEYLKDIWDTRNLGISRGIGTSTHKMDFTSISQQWLKQATKDYMR
ncbi:IS1 family transposase, partial [Aetokthonos hydrillicola]|nr:IS1 family transposase [Aetokthonos hydrillicola CCALA 1050]